MSHPAVLQFLALTSAKGSSVQLLLVEPVDNRVGTSLLRLCSHHIFDLITEIGHISVGGLLCKFCINVWAGFVGDFLIEPFVSPGRLTSPVIVTGIF